MLQLHRQTKMAAREEGSGAKPPGIEPAQDIEALDLSVMSEHLKWTGGNVMNTHFAPGGKKGIISRFTNKSTTLTYAVVLLPVLVLELVVNSAAFHCPSKTHQMVGRCWLYLPALIIFLVSLLLVVDIRDVYKRCLVRDFCHFGFFCHHTFPTIVRSFVGASVWLWAAFWQEDYYVCSVAGQDPQEKGAPMNTLLYNVRRCGLWRFFMELFQGLRDIK
ncbi:uncharacterized protein LOC111343094 [Stylophora pistillata]|uniref:uncharacterized protein LOC111343094 n=1 Tax=Stylophora pistillata TaxID=50429 RepID=UPI000C05104D|nr:uncharacterized protein LOC111343094 [Stylophora pistillata]